MRLWFLVLLAVAGCMHPLGEVRAPDGSVLHRAVCGSMMTCYVQADSECKDFGGYEVEGTDAQDDGATLVGKTVIQHSHRELLYKCRNEPRY